MGAMTAVRLVKVIKCRQGLRNQRSIQSNRATAALLCLWGILIWGVSSNAHDAKASSLENLL